MVFLTDGVQFGDNEMPGFVDSENRGYSNLVFRDYWAQDIIVGMVVVDYVHYIHIGTSRILGYQYYCISRVIFNCICYYFIIMYRPLT